MNFARQLDRRQLMRLSAGFSIAAVTTTLGGQAFAGPLTATSSGPLQAGDRRDRWKETAEKGLQWLAGQQGRSGGWSHPIYMTAVSALAGTALICSGSTTTQGPYAQEIRGCVDFLLSMVRRNGLIGDPRRDNRYTYGHGFAMLFLSQVLGEEEDSDRRSELVEALQNAVAFSVNAQTKAGGWGYVSAKEDNFDEGSTTITQVQGLRGCRNAGLVVPKEAIEKAKKYIYGCQNKDGGISYNSSSAQGASRPAITAAALAALYNAGDYESKYVPKMWKYARNNLHKLSNDRLFGHWHYTYLYYTQVVYRQGPDQWNPFRDKICDRLRKEQRPDGHWKDDNVNNVYASAINLIVLQMDYGYLPIYQR